MKTRICAQCRNAYADCDEPDISPADADVYVEGTIIDHGGVYSRKRGYRAYLCRNHAEMLLNDGADFRVFRELVEKPKLEPTKVDIARARDRLEPGDRRGGER